MLSNEDGSIPSGVVSDDRSVTTEVIPWDLGGDERLPTLVVATSTDDVYSSDDESTVPSVFLLIRDEGKARRVLLPTVSLGVPRSDQESSIVALKVVEDNATRLLRETLRTYRKVGFDGDGPHVPARGLLVVLTGSRGTSLSYCVHGSRNVSTDDLLVTVPISHLPDRAPDSIVRPERFTKEEMRTFLDVKLRDAEAKGQRGWDDSSDGSRLAVLRSLVREAVQLRLDHLRTEKKLGACFESRWQLETSEVALAAAVLLGAENLEELRRHVTRASDHAFLSEGSRTDAGKADDPPNRAVLATSLSEETSQEIDEKFGGPTGEFTLVTAGQADGIIFLLERTWGYISSGEGDFYQFSVNAPLKPDLLLLDIPRGRRGAVRVSPEEASDVRKWGGGRFVCEDRREILLKGVIGYINGRPIVSSPDQPTGEVLVLGDTVPTVFHVHR